MAYSVETDVEALVAKFTVDGSSKPNSTQVSAIIDMVDADIDVALAASGVTTPVTSPTAAMNWLKKVSAEGTAAMVLKSMFPDVVGPAETPAYAFWEKRYRESLKMIQNMTFLSSIFGNSLVYPGTYLTRNPDQEEDIGTIAEPQFKVDKVF